MWVVVQPDDTVVIRIARSEMGQGTLTGLAQLVAEELDCDWGKVTTEYPTPGQNLARDRAWGNFSTGGSRGIRKSHEYVRQGGAMARELLIRAAAQGWDVPAAECRAEASVISHPPSGRSTTYGAVAALAATLESPQEVTLKDPALWKIAGKPLKRLDTADKLTGKQVYGIDLEVARNAERGDPRLPGLRRQLARFRRGGGDEHARGQAGGEGRRHGRGSRRRHLVAGQDGARCPADRMGRRTEHRGVSATIATMLAEGLDAEEAYIGNQSGDARGGLGDPPPTWSMRSMPTPTRTTRPWSR